MTNLVDISADVDNEFDIVNLLNSVDYKTPEDYVPSDFALEFVNFIKLVNGEEGEENKTPLVHYKMLDTLVSGETNVANLCHRGMAKALSLDTRLPTPDGWKTIGNVKEGDYIYGEDGKPYNVIKKSEVFNKSMYRLTLKDGRTLDVSEDHINTVIHQRQKRVDGKRVNYLDRRDLTTKELLKIPLFATRNKTNKNPTGKESRVWIPLTKAVDYPVKELPIDPYTLGLAIGDGSMDCQTGFCRLHGHIDDLPTLLKEVPTECGEVLLDRRFPTVARASLKGLGPAFKQLGLNCHGDDKFIPEEYKTASIDQRLAIAQGLMDTDGTVYKNGCTAFTSNSLRLIKDLKEIIFSLGGTANYSKMNNAYRLSISINLQMFRLPRKRDRQHLACMNRIPLVSIEKIEDTPSQCLMVDSPESTFLAGDYFVTHNTTVMGEYLILYLGVYRVLPGFGKINLALYVSDSIENGVKNMRKNLEYRWDNSEFLKEFIPYTRFTDIRWEFTNADGDTLVVKGYGGKALSLDSTLYTPDGTTTIGECQIGDQIYGPDGLLTNIIKKSEVFNKPMYRLTLKDGRSIKLSEDHINSVVINTNPNNKVRMEEFDLTTLELLKQPLVHTKKGNLNHKGTSSKHLVFVKNTEPLQYPERDLSVDPYTLGVILGDGRIQKPSCSVELTTHIDDLPTYVKNIPYEFGKGRLDTRNTSTWIQSIRGLGPALKAMDLGVHGSLKFIPEPYFYGSIQQRLSLLQGLMDTDGTVTTSGRTSFCSMSPQLLSDVTRLARSLGATVSNNKKLFNIEIWLNVPLFRLDRKLTRQRFDRKDKLVAVTFIERIDDEPSQCIAVDNIERQFLTDNYFRTHNTGVRGAKEMGTRPQLAILDDLISDEDARSNTVISAIEDTVYKAVDYALHPKQKMLIWSGTPFNAKDPLYKAIESGAWAVNVFPVCEEFPVNKEEFRSSWPDRFDYEYVKSQYDKAVKLKKIDTFNQELMLRIMSDEDRLIPDSSLRFFDSTIVYNNRSRFNFYITTDFATSEKQKSDFSVISVWAYNNNGDWLWVDGKCKRQTMDKNIDDLFMFCQKWGPQQVGIEVSGQQQGFVSWIQREMLIRNVFFALASDKNSGQPGIRPNTNKMERFNLMVPEINAGKVFFPHDKINEPEIIEAMDEIKLVSVGGMKSKHDDFLDTISMLANLTPWRPSATGDLKQNLDDMWDFGETEEQGYATDSYIV